MNCASNISIWDSWFMCVINFTSNPLKHFYQFLVKPENWSCNKSTLNSTCVGSTLCYWAAYLNSWARLMSQHTTVGYTARCRPVSFGFLFPYLPRHLTLFLYSLWYFNIHPYIRIIDALSRPLLIIITTMFRNIFSFSVTSTFHLHSLAHFLLVNLCIDFLQLRKLL